MSEINWDEVHDALEAEVKEALAGLIEGAEDDLKSYGRDIAVNMVIALQSGNAAMREELVAQAETLAEIHRIKAVNAQWALIGSIQKAVYGVAFRLLGVAA